MRGFLLFIGYSSYIGSVGDGLLGLYALWVLISNNLALLSLSLNDFLAQYVEFIPIRLIKWSILRIDKRVDS